MAGRQARQRHPKLPVRSGLGVGGRRQKDLFGQVRVSDVFGSVRGRMCQTERNRHRPHAGSITLRLKSGRERRVDEIRCGSISFLDRCDQLGRRSTLDAEFAVSRSLE